MPRKAKPKQRGGARKGTGPKIEEGRVKAIQIHDSVQPITDQKIGKLADQRGCTRGRVLDDLVEQMINFTVNL